jgi:glucokinase
MTATAVGIDVGGTSIKGVRLEDGKVVERAHRPTPREAVDLVDAVEALARALGEGMPVGVGAAGLVDHDDGVLVWAPHLPGEDLDLAAPLAARLAVPVVVDNDANLAALAEHRLGAVAGADPVLMITLGTGIGLGIVLGGEIFRGRGHAGEAGHVTVDPHGEACACGRRGCWETLVSGAKLDRDAGRLLGAGSSASDLVAAARRGDEAAAKALTEAGHWLARGIEALVLVFDPAAVVVGGAAAGGGDFLLNPVRELLTRTEGASHRDPVVLTTGILGSDAGAIGAAICAAEEGHR